MTTTVPTTAREAKAAGLVRIGDWGYSSTNAGAIWCKPDDRAAVMDAYEILVDGDMGPNVLDGVTAAGGVYIADAK